MPTVGPFLQDLRYSRRLGARLQLCWLLQFCQPHKKRKSTTYFDAKPVDPKQGLLEHFMSQFLIRSILLAYDPIRMSKKPYNLYRGSDFN